jgi:hypothetical protein
MHKCLEPRSGDRTSIIREGLRRNNLRLQQDHIRPEDLRMLCRRSAAQTRFIRFTQSSQSLALGLALPLLRSSLRDGANLIQSEMFGDRDPRLKGLWH